MPKAGTYADRRQLRRVTIASRDRFPPMGARQNVALYSFMVQLIRLQQTITRMKNTFRQNYITNFKTTLKKASKPRDFPLHGVIFFLSVIMTYLLCAREKEFGNRFVPKQGRDHFDVK